MMRFYPKKLRNIKDLERERNRLLRASRQLEKEEFLPAGIFSGVKKDKKNEEDLLSDFLPGLSPVAGQLIKIVQRIVFKKSARQEPANDSGHRSTNKRKNLLNSLAKEFIGGYLKWKAIEWGFKGLGYIIRSKVKSKKSNE